MCRAFSLFGGGRMKLENRGRAALLLRLGEGVVKIAVDRGPHGEVSAPPGRAVDELLVGVERDVTVGEADVEPTDRVAQAARLLGAAVAEEGDVRRGLAEAFR